MNIVLRLCLLSALALLVGCGGSTSNPPLAPAASVSALTPEGLRATLSENVSTVAVNSTVTYTISLTNPTTQTISFPFGDCAGGDASVPNVHINIVDAAGASVYPVGPQPGVPCVVLQQPLIQIIAPGQTLAEILTPVSPQGYPAVFAKPGVYTATATFFTKLSPAASTTTVVSLPITAR